MPRVLKRHGECCRRSSVFSLGIKRVRWRCGHLVLVHYNNACERFAGMLRLVALVAVCAGSYACGFFVAGQQRHGKLANGQASKHGTVIRCGVAYST